MLDLAQNPTATHIVKYYSQFQRTIFYNDFMYRHYRSRYSESRKSWNFIQTFILWKKVQEFEESLYQAHISDLLNLINKKSHVSITTKKHQNNF